MRSERLFEIVFILLNQKRTTAQELAKKFAVSIRTVYRDIDILSCVGIPVYTVQGTGGGIFIDETYTINKSIVTQEEQDKILLALQCLSPVDEIHTESILNRLSAVFQRHADWDTVKQAILECRALRIEYLSSYGEKTERTIYPLRLLFKSKAWYVESLCTDKNAYRLFRLNRMLSVMQTVKIFKRMELLNKLPDRTEYSDALTLTNIKLKCTAGIAYRFYDEFPPDLITKNMDGSYTLSVYLPIDHWLYGFILSLDTEVEILEPETLKQGIIDFAEKIAAHHKKV